VLAGAFAPEPISFGVTLAITGVCSLSVLNTANAYVQTTTPPRLRGRVMSLYIAIFLGGSILGGPTIGWIANTAGPRWAMVLGSAAGFIAFAIAAVYFVRTRRVGLEWRMARRWPIAIRIGAGDTREDAAINLAVIEAESRRI